MPSAKPGSKYYPLFQYLKRQPGERVSLTLAQIEAILGQPLPRSARRSQAFWSNRARGGYQADAWLEAGFETKRVDLRGRRIQWARPVQRYIVRRESGVLRWNADMVRGLRRHLGADQAGLAEVLGVRQQTISEWETGQYAPSRSRSKHLSLIAERAGFPLEGDSSPKD